MILVIAHRGKPAAAAASEKLIAYLDARSIAYAEYEEDIDIDLNSVRHAVALGGDGTILKAAHVIAGRHIPLLGVQFGRLGFLAGCSFDEMLDAVDAMLGGSIRVEERSALTAQVCTEDGAHESVFALNEVVVARGASGRIITYEIEIAGAPVAKMRGDGVLVATATGSTGYALSAGGPVVAPGFRGLTVVPIAPHTLHARAIMTDPDDEVVIRLVESKRDEGDLFVDGERLTVDSPPKEVRVSAGKQDMLLARYGAVSDGSKDFYTSVSSVFFGGDARA